MTNTPRFIFGIFCAGVFLLPGILVAATGNAGVPAGPLWFSKDPFYTDDEVTIFAPLYNSSSYRFRGSVALSDNGKAIGTKDFLLEPGGGSQIIAFPWKATGGEHAFALAVTDGSFFADNKNFVDLPISGKTSTEVRRFVERRPAESENRKESSADDLEPMRYLSTDIPKAIISDAVPVLGGLERFRVDQARRAIGVVDAIRASIVAGDDGVATSSAETTAPNVGAWSAFGEGLADGDFLRTPWEYVKLFFMLVYTFFTTNIYAFYILLCVILYKVVRGVFNLFFA